VPPVEEIVVTAQKREQTLIDIPQAISVISGDWSGTRRPPSRTI
jgi:outer membrane receptor protein involved in Fe transport